MTDISSDLSIGAYINCSQCIKELPEGESPESYARFSIGFTTLGIQVWCLRHDCNIIHIDFEGEKHPANTHT